MTLRKIASIATGLGVLLAGLGKFFQGEMPNMTEIMLAITTLTAAFGFQSPKA